MYPSLYLVPDTELIRPKLLRTSHKPFSRALQKLFRGALCAVRSKSIPRADVVNPRNSSNHCLFCKYGPSRSFAVTPARAEVGLYLTPLT